MIASFWSTLPKQFVGLSPMDGVTDVPFRTIVKKYGQPDLMFTEFSSVEGLCRGAAELLREFRYTTAQRPIVAQIYGTTPDFFRQMSIVLCQLGFDGIDINMGCPAKNVAHAGAGAALIQTPELAQRIIAAAWQGVQEWQRGLSAVDCPNITPTLQHLITEQAAVMNPKPDRTKHISVSVKTRIGFDSIVVRDWMQRLVVAQPVAISLHGRTLRQGYSGLANWEAIGEAVATIKAANPTVLVVGNGDVPNRTVALSRCAEYGVDGVLIGRASFGNPWVFTTKQPTFLELAAVALEHAQLYEATYQSDPKYSFLPMRKHLAWYIRGMPNASEIRSHLMRTQTSQAVADILGQFGLLSQ